MAFTADRMPQHEKQAQVLAEIVVPTSVGERCLSRSNGLCLLVVDFRAKHESFCDLPLNEPPGEERVFHAGSAIDLIANTAVGRPRAIALLNPYRQSRPDLTITKSNSAVATRELKKGKHAYLRTTTRFLNETIFRTKLDVPHSVIADSREIRTGDHDVDLKIGCGAHIEFEGQQTPRAYASPRSTVPNTYAS
jgi:hypothetical protein